ncbi:right-handed parallel beta-helix repeat-containing protein [Duganella qianjiadongensis]|uniref:Right handed beta helix domain-containing protein n=1 Tax=Duganella qianjiadongensis TaxID=2692176 RepID=A0ABW9VGL3_9BURK|nr:right-handed parallel beta-helix repeat-containing protein [Duganella qianjiadongensis]MYM37882.1 hypothetical protein [Duganella qianjiadongensis]
MKTLRIALGWLALLASPAWAANGTGSKAALIHVDCSVAGDVAGDGSLKAPLRRLDALNALVLQAGSHVRFRRGSVCRGTFSPAPGSSGTAAAPIVVDSYGPPALPRPHIAAGCLPTVPVVHPSQQGAAMRYAPLCQRDDGPVRRAALHLYNTQYWEIRDLELSNDGLSEAGRVGLLVQLENYGTGVHYRLDKLLVHHVRGYLKDEAGRALAYKATGGILFEVTRDAETPEQTGQPTRFADVRIENSEVYQVDGIGISNRSAWMCRSGGAPCGDYAPYKGRPELLEARAPQVQQEYTPSTGLVIRNNRVHNIGGDGIIVRTASAPLVESNLVYDIWLRAPGNSAGVWAINTDDALFRYNEVHDVRLPQGDKLFDGMAFDADMGTRNTRIEANFSHDNGGGLVLFCACGQDGLGRQAMVSGAVVVNNLSLNDRRRAIMVAGLDDALVSHNLVVAAPEAALLEVHDYPTPDRLTLRSNRFITRGTAPAALYHTVSVAGAGSAFIWQDNRYSGYGTDVQGQRESLAQAEVDRLVQRWMQTSGFRQHAYRALAR